MQRYLRKLHIGELTQYFARVDFGVPAHYVISLGSQTLSLSLYHLLTLFSIGFYVTLYVWRPTRKPWFYLDLYRVLRVGPEMNLVVAGIAVNSLYFYWVLYRRNTIILIGLIRKLILYHCGEGYFLPEFRGISGRFFQRFAVKIYGAALGMRLVTRKYEKISLKFKFLLQIAKYYLLYL